MKKFLIPALATLALMSAGSAWAWSDVSGTVKSIDMKTHQLVLDNGKTYDFGTTSAANIKVGDKVTVSAEIQNGKNMANKLSKTG